MSPTNSMILFCGNAPKFTASTWELPGNHPHPYRREKIQADDGALLNLDWLENNETAIDAPVLVVFPGITGHSRSGYLVHLVDGAYRKGWRVAVMVYPGTDLSRIETARFIRGHVPHDVDHGLKHIRGLFPAAPIYTVGYSMGAAMLTNYLAQEGPNSLTAASISCSNPFDVVYSVKRIKKGLVNKLYNIHFLSALKDMYRLNQDVFEKHFPELPAESVYNFSSVEEYDMNITMKYFGFTDLQKFYVALGCHDKVEKVSVPMLVAHAEDDPIVGTEALPQERLATNPNIVTMITKTGGHTGWLQGLNPMGPSWFDEVALEWLSAVNSTQKESHRNSIGSPMLDSGNRKSRPTTRSITRKDLNTESR